MSDLDDIFAIVSGSPAPVQASEADEAAQHRERVKDAVARLADSIAAIKSGIEMDNLSSAAEAWFELTAEEQESIWIAPTRNEGGKRVSNEHAPFTTHERAVIKSAEFRRAHFGDGSDE